MTLKFPCKHVSSFTGPAILMVPSGN